MFVMGCGDITVVAVFTFPFFICFIVLPEQSRGRTQNVVANSPRKVAKFPMFSGLADCRCGNWIESYVV